jgi:Mycothiol maleylpyruvate isomerase N-terminal domain
MRRLVERLPDAQLLHPVNEHWTVAGVLGHIAFWDARAGWLAGKLEAGGSFSDADREPDDVDWINDSTRPLIHAIEPRKLAEIALSTADAVDRRVAVLDPQAMYPGNPDSPLNAVRAGHRGEHLDEIEQALSRST